MSFKLSRDPHCVEKPRDVVVGSSISIRPSTPGCLSLDEKSQIQGLGVKPASGTHNGQLGSRGQRRRPRSPVFRYRPRWVVMIRPSFFHAKAMLAARLGLTPVRSRNSFVVKVFPRRS